MQEAIQQNTVPVNRDIETFLMGVSSLYCQQEYALAQFGQYMQDLQALASGITFEQLGISERRKSNFPKVFEPIAATGGYNVAGPDALRNPSNSTPGSIALLQLKGVMRADGGISNPGVGALAEDLRAAYANPNISGVVIEANSGGGELLAGTMLKSAIQERNKPVVVFSHLAASAAYQAASAADEIIASGPSAEVGSIGVLIPVNQKMLEDYRANYTDFYGQGAPGKNSAIRKAIAGDFSGIQGRADTLTTQFQAEIADARHLRGDKTVKAETLNGSMYSAADAKDRGLIDMIGTMKDAMSRVKALQVKYK